MREDMSCQLVTDMAMRQVWHKYIYLWGKHSWLLQWLWWKNFTYSEEVIIFSVGSRKNWAKKKLNVVASTGW